MSATARAGRSFDAAMFHDEEQIHQLRHQTKNLLQAMTLTLVDASLEMPSSTEDLIQDLVRRMQVTAAMADVLFGTTGPRTTFEATLKTLCENVALAFEPLGCRVTVNFRGRVSYPPRLHRDLLQAAHEMVGNAVKHGRRGRGDQSAMSAEDIGIRVCLRQQSRAVSLMVHEQGQGFPSGWDTRPDGGTRILDHLARTMRGSLSRRNWRGAVIRLVVPLDPHRIQPAFGRRPLLNDDATEMTRMVSRVKTAPHRYGGQPTVRSQAGLRIQPDALV